MKVDIKLEVSAKNFWNIIVDSIRQDAGQEEIYEGMTFEKQLPTTLSGFVKVKIIIVKYREAVCYSADFITQKSTIHATYHIKEEEQGIIISYEEDEEFFNKWDYWNAKIMHLLYKRNKIQKLVWKVKSIEKYVKGDL